jgi:uncharacterized protein YozE (UPF0346 family)
MTFRAYLATRKNEDSPVGDLARDALRDDGFPRSSRMLTAFERYLIRRNACDGAIRALREAWEDYESRELQQPLPG